MARVTRGTRGVKRRKKILSRAEGFRGGRSRLLRTAAESVDRALQYAYRDRKVRKREFRKLWIIRINAAARSQGITYSRLMEGLRKAGVGLDRKMLSDMAVTDPASFNHLVQLARDNH
ncbi:MAG: 50S ribosomal protein L20 [Deltaproteobacteria bacterium]|nr:50S ribosomal protein L20 [Deltaproteobacteria bacterium]MBW2306211.1 50S ribosomal protein L20 [Deltaproteobacteria bacterium]